MSNLIARFAKNESGATAIEYGLIAGIMAVALIAAFGMLAPQLKSTFDNVATTMKDGVSE
ncbi:Flp family type IVb pilin [Jiella mangrovi]|uniref:Flp family type IVb pilin n=1 Tax=Jiella mangrovi TaxID=2821407 RepID=A0ABS4BFV8_9HYPH|nr:Flp family type IVb pilin [Jiella mangrovi]MBP0615638.1 Flp family type IVb pilin [Jiella mangrovi]